VLGLLEGIRVVETGVLLSVDNLGGLLGDAGADVVKVESPQLGDYLRSIPPLMGKDWSVAHLASNRNKRSITIDARTQAGRKVVSRLLATADVFITGNVGDTNRKLGLDFEATREIKPDIVYCQVTGFGSSGPYADIPTHGRMMDALGAGTPLMELSDDGLVQPVAGGHRSEGGSGVIIGPLYAAFAVAAGLSRRDRTGDGCYIDVSFADGALASKLISAIGILNADKVDPEAPMGDITLSAKYQHYQTADGKYILFCCIEQKFWDKFCRVSDREDLLERHNRGQAVDFGFDDEDLRRELQRTFHTKSQQEWVAIASEHDIPMGPALRFDEVADDPHLVARGMLVQEDHPLLGPLVTLGSPIRVPGESFAVRSAPSLGQHTDEILSSLGHTQGEIDELRQDGVV
jgi:crotonobetainyl-CoA:carnitine CoA-transferase CaiB-like acyl-CoA transferase